MSIIVVNVIEILTQFKKYLDIQLNHISNRNSNVRSANNSIIVRFKFTYMLSMNITKN